MSHVLSADQLLRRRLLELLRVEELLRLGLLLRCTEELLLDEGREKEELFLAGGGE